MACLISALGQLTIQLFFFLINFDLLFKIYIIEIRTVVVYGRVEMDLGAQGTF